MGLAAKRGRRPRAERVARAREEICWPIRHADGLQIIEAPRLSELGWLVHGFSTRVGGASRIPRNERGAAHDRKGQARGNPSGVLNLGLTNWDAPEAARENREKFAAGIGAAKMPLVTLRQIHSDLIHFVLGPGNPSGELLRDPLHSAAAQEEPPPGDALFTIERGVLLAVQTADCIPILLADPKRRVIAAIHAGWRGTLARIAEKTLGRMRMELRVNPADVVAAIGPGIGPCCYEVGPEVVREFAARFPNAREWFHAPPGVQFEQFASGAQAADPNWLPWLTMRPPGHPAPEPRVRLDLIAANRAILESAGVPGERISASGYCTSCRTDLFFSYRREGPTGRQMAAIALH